MMPSSHGAMLSESVLIRHIPELPKNTHTAPAFKPTNLPQTQVFHPNCPQSGVTEGLGSQTPQAPGPAELDVVEGLQALLAAPCAEQNPPSGLCRPTALAEPVPLPQHRLSVSSTTAWHRPFACEQVPMSLVTPWHTAPSLAVQPDLYLENIWNYSALKFSISSLLKLHVCLCWRETGRLGWLVTR